ncbi:hypothetical protein [Rhizobium leguminosarum]|jgi:hypothetical protein|uniref:hypothetical protein n=1 Tax=Rhizobium leguminosarum TaxID=384 RepID=UPI002E1617C2|nr:hypothetical protein U8Q02_38110 [Rhizobium leguminosarum]
MGLRDGGRRHRPAEEIREDEKTTFNRKVSIQQFVNYNAPLFRAFAKRRASVEDVATGELLVEPARLANALAIAIAARLHGKHEDEVTAAQARPFRLEASEYVAQQWADDLELDVEAAADAVSRAVELAGREWDHDPYRDEGIQDFVSEYMTMVSASGVVTKCVLLYDFRQNHDELVGRLTSEVVQAAVAAARDMLKDTPATDGDRRNLVQTLTRNFTGILEACYKRKVREVAERISEWPEEKKSSFFATRFPVDELLADFRSWYVCLSGWAMIAADSVAAQPQPDSAPAYR